MAAEQKTRLMDTIRLRVSDLFAKGKKNEKMVPAINIDEAVLMDKVRQSDLFKELSSENIEEMLAHMEIIQFELGKTVVRQGAEGDYYYILLVGTGTVSRRTDGGKTVPIANLEAPVGFGEESLISNAKRNASVVMTSDGVLMRLSKENFGDYVKGPVLTWFSPMDAQARIAGGAQWIDVRDVKEFAKSHLHGATSLPIESLRAHITELDEKTLYICYCQNGRLSSTAAFLLTQRGLNVGVLQGGLKSLQLSEQA